MSRRVEVEVFATTVLGQNGEDCPGICLTCTRCDLEVKVAGETVRSYRRGYVMLKSDCSEGESNFYYCDDEPVE